MPTGPRGPRPAWREPVFWAVWPLTAAVIGLLLIDTPAGGEAPLEAVADVSLADAPDVVNRERASRRVLVTCNAAGRDVAGVVRDNRAAIASGCRRATGWSSAAGTRRRRRPAREWSRSKRWRET